MVVTLVMTTQQNLPLKVLWSCMKLQPGEATSRHEEATLCEEVTSQRGEVTSRRGLLLQFHALCHVAPWRSNVAMLTVAH